MADHLASVARQTGKKEAVPDLKPPPATLHVWRAFQDLHAARTSSGFAPNPIIYSEIRAWSSLMRWPLAPWEVEALCAVDQVYLRLWADSKDGGGHG